MMELNKLDSAIFSDLMDEMHIKNCVIPRWRSNKPEYAFYGPVRTMLLKEVETADENIKTGLGFLEETKDGEILIIKGSDKFAYFGEMMARLAMRGNLRGVIIDGDTRDSNFTFSKDCSLPILAKGYTPIDIKGRGRVEAVDAPILIDCCVINSGDYVFADKDAVVVVPQELRSEIEKRLVTMIEQEEKRRKLISVGATVAEILEEVQAF